MPNTCSHSPGTGNREPRSRLATGFDYCIPYYCSSRLSTCRTFILLHLPTFPPSHLYTFPPLHLPTFPPLHLRTFPLFHLPTFPPSHFHTSLTSLPAEFSTQAGASVFFHQNVKVNTVSLSGTELAEIVPLWSLRIWRERLRPIPEPLCFVVKNGMKILSRTSGSIPVPLSAT